jgi:hypothetical protein
VAFGRGDPADQRGYVECAGRLNENGRQFVKGTQKISSRDGNYGTMGGQSRPESATANIRGALITKRLAATSL